MVESRRTSTAPCITWPPLTMSSDEDVNPYELLDVAMEATEADIRKAYRTRSLKVHPDRVSQHSLNLAE